MILILRIVCIACYMLFICIVGAFRALSSPRNPKHIIWAARRFAKIKLILGFKVIMRLNTERIGHTPCVYIVNHQNNYDLVVSGDVIQLGTVTVGKRSLAWVPFFGQLYWLSGNILLDRNNKSKAHSVLTQIVEKIQQRNISVWMYPEGTRSRGRGLLPFKIGAFHVALAAKIPIIPICISDTQRQIKLNRWNNGEVIVEMLPPISTEGYTRESIRELAGQCHQLMAEKIAQLDAEVKERAIAAKH